MRTSSLNLVRAVATALLLVSAVGGDAFAARLSGNIIHDGAGSGQYYVYVFHPSLELNVIGTDILTTPGRWEVSVPNGEYFIFSYRDMNRNFIPSRGEPIGFFGDMMPAKVVVSGADVGNLDIDMVTPNTGAELQGTVSYGGNESGRIWVVPHFTPTFSLPDVRGTPWTMTDPGNFQVFVILDGTYYVTAYMDLNGDMLHGPGEPIGTSDPVNVHVTPGVTYFNVDISLQVNALPVEGRTWSEIKSLYDR